MFSIDEAYHSLNQSALVQQVVKVSWVVYSYRMVESVALGKVVAACQCRAVGLVRGKGRSRILEFKVELAVRVFCQQTTAKIPYDITWPKTCGRYKSDGYEYNILVRGLAQEELLHGKVFLGKKGRDRYGAAYALEYVRRGRAIVRYISSPDTVTYLKRNTLADALSRWRDIVK